MPDRCYKLMTKRDLLALVKKGPYHIDTESGLVFNAKGHQLATYPNDDGHLFVRVYWNGKRKAIAVHRLVWMAATGCTIPEKFEVHHRDADPENNAFYNLMCVHEMDHRKFHEEHYEESDEEVPF